MGKATAAAPTVRVEIVMDKCNLIHPTEGRLIRPGDVVDLPAALAGDLIAAGKAIGFARVRVLKPTMIGRRSAAIGEVVPCDPGRARTLAARGLVEVIDQPPEGPPRADGARPVEEWALGRAVG